MSTKSIASRLAGATALLLATAVAAQATIVTVFDGIAAGRDDFDDTVTDAGSTVMNDVLTTLVPTGNSIDRGAYTITRNNGDALNIQSYGTLSGQAIGINPFTTGTGGSDPRTDPLDYFASGVTFTFDSAVNAIGFEVGDWSTCCQNPTTDLYISFDGGAPILVASDSTGSGTRPSQADPMQLVYEIFVAAFDDSGSFTTVSFWGNGLGEYLVAGGDVRYALLDEGTLEPAPIPLPAAGWMMLAGLGGLAALRRRKTR